MPFNQKGIFIHAKKIISNIAPEKNILYET